jgi:hypothetical protein
MREEGSSEEQKIVDKPPQLVGDGCPYYSWGPEPSFDVPSTVSRPELWSAHASSWRAPTRS